MGDNMSLFKKIFSLLNICFPKDNIILFNSFPFFTDNAKSVYEYIKTNRSDIVNHYRIYWMADTDIDRTKYPDICVVRKKTIKGVWLFLRAKYIFATHGYFKGIKSPDRQFNVNLWHGCGYKGNSEEEKGYRGNYNIVTSKVYLPIHSDLFRIPEDRILITGLPRNDVIFLHNNNLGKLGIDKKKYRKILLWLPTYRKATIGHEGTDGNIDQFGYRDILNTNDHIDQLLREKQYLLLLKIHPLESYSEEKRDHKSNVAIISNNDLEKNNLSVYDLFEDTDILLSDYSSVITDYMLTKKPIAYISGDYDDYLKSRGFVFDDMNEVMAGPVIRNAIEFEQYIENLEQINDKYFSKSEEIRLKFHQFQDGKSAQRVVEYFFGE